MSTVDEQAIPCKEVKVGNSVQVTVKSKESLLDISHTLKAPILKCENKYSVVGPGASYEYKE